MDPKNFPIPTYYYSSLKSRTSVCRQTISYVVPYKFADAHLSAFYHPSSITSSTGGKIFETVEFVHFTILIPLFNNEITV